MLPCMVKDVVSLGTSILQWLFHLLHSCCCLSQWLVYVHHSCNLQWFKILKYASNLHFFCFGAVKHVSQVIKKERKILAS